MSHRPQPHPISLKEPIPLFCRLGLHRWKAWRAWSNPHWCYAAGAASHRERAECRRCGRIRIRWIHRR